MVNFCKIAIENVMFVIHMITSKDHHHITFALTINNENASIRKVHEIRWKAKSNVIYEM